MFLLVKWQPLKLVIIFSFFFLMFYFYLCILILFCRGCSSFPSSKVKNQRFSPILGNFLLEQRVYFGIETKSPSRPSCYFCSLFLNSSPSFYYPSTSSLAASVTVIIPTHSFVDVGVSSIPPVVSFKPIRDPFQQDFYFASLFAEYSSAGVSPFVLVATSFPPRETTGEVIDKRANRKRIVEVEEDTFFKQATVVPLSNATDAEPRFRDLRGSPS